MSVQPFEEPQGIAVKVARDIAVGQQRGNLLDAQVELCMERALSEGYTVHPGFIFRRVASSADLKGTEMIAAIYARDSGVGQQRGRSLDGQVDPCMERALADACTVAPERIFLEFGSGADLDRPELQRLRNLAASGKLDALYVHSRSRLSRNSQDFMMLIKEFQECEVQVNFLK